MTTILRKTCFLSSWNSILRKTRFLSSWTSILRKTRFLISWPPYCERLAHRERRASSLGERRRHQLCFHRTSCDTQQVLPHHSPWSHFVHGKSSCAKWYNLTRPFREQTEFAITTVIVLCFKVNHSRADWTIRAVALQRLVNSAWQSCRTFYPRRSHTQDSNMHSGGARSIQNNHTNGQVMYVHLEFDHLTTIKSGCRAEYSHLVPCVVNQRFVQESSRLTTSGWKEVAPAQMHESCVHGLLNRSVQDETRSKATHKWK